MHTHTHFTLLANLRKSITLHPRVCNYVIMFSHTAFIHDLQQHLNGQVKDNQYYYRDHLMALDACHPQHEDLSSFKSSSVISPLALENWSRELSTHPDKFFTHYILRGISQGFRIGFNHGHHLSQPHSTMLTQNPEVISHYLSREVSLARMKVIPHSQAKDIHTSPIGAIPKKNKPGKWRLIVDLSSPTDHSVNDGISSEWSSVSYPTVDHLSAIVLHQGKGAFLVKADIKEAYRMVPVHPCDQHLLGVQWEGNVYVFPFGQRSAPRIFLAVADALQWILVQKGLQILHYLDDFIIISGSFTEAVQQKQLLIDTFELLGVPLESSKLEGPATCLTFLGIEFDTVNLQIRLPSEKLSHLHTELSQAVSRKCITKKSLQSLAGLLQHATKVIRPGRAFLRRLYALQSVGSSPSHHIRLSVAARGDILWWYVFASNWNGLSLLWNCARVTPEVIVVSDASGSWGCGAFCLPHWFNLQWSVNTQTFPIAVKELFPVVIAAAIYGNQWSGKLVLFRVDNMAVVEVLKATYSRESHLMHLIRMLVFFAAHFNFWFSASHIAGSENTLADSLSRNNAPFFLSQVSTASRDPSRIPLPLLKLLECNLTWTTTAWMSLFRAILQQL